MKKKHLTMVAVERSRVQSIRIRDIILYLVILWAIVATALAGYYWYQVCDCYDTYQEYINELGAEFNVIVDDLASGGENPNDLKNMESILQSVISDAEKYTLCSDGYIVNVDATQHSFSELIKKNLTSQNIKDMLGEPSRESRSTVGHEYLYYGGSRIQFCFDDGILKSVNY